MIEKILLSLFLLVCGALGFLMKELLSDIKGTQKEHTSSLLNLRQHVLRMEDKQAVLTGEVTRLKEAVTLSSATQREVKSVLDHGLYEMRQQLKVQSDEQFMQKQNFGKVIVIVQKLYAAAVRGKSNDTAKN